MPEAQLWDTGIHYSSLSIFVRVCISVFSFCFLKNRILTQLSLGLSIFIVVKYINIKLAIFTIHKCKVQWLKYTHKVV